MLLKYILPLIASGEELGASRDCEAIISFPDNYGAK